VLDADPAGDAPEEPSLDPPVAAGALGAADSLPEPDSLRDVEVSAAVDAGAAPDLVRESARESVR
jgi:hypothetical protein